MESALASAKEAAARDLETVLAETSSKKDADREAAVSRAATLAEEAKAQALLALKKEADEEGKGALAAAATAQVRTRRCRALVLMGWWDG